MFVWGPDELINEFIIYNLHILYKYNNTLACTL